MPDKTVRVDLATYTENPEWPDANPIQPPWPPTNSEFYKIRIKGSDMDVSVTGPSDIKFVTKGAFPQELNLKQKVTIEAFWYFEHGVGIWHLANDAGPGRQTQRFTVKQRTPDFVVTDNHIGINADFKEYGYLLFCDAETKDGNPAGFIVDPEIHNQGV